MNLGLLKRVAQYVRATSKIPKEIGGYSNEELVEAVTELQSKGIIYYGKVAKMTPTVGNYTVKVDDRIPVENSQIVDSVFLSEHKFKNTYGEDFY